MSRNVWKDSELRSQNAYDKIKIKVKEREKMPKITKIFPLAALAVAGIVGLATPSNTYADDNYVINYDTNEGKNPRNVPLCHTVNGILQDSATTTFTWKIWSLDYDQTEFDVTQIRFAGGGTTAANGSISTVAGENAVNVTLNYNYNISTNNNTKQCVYLDFANTIKANQEWGKYQLDIQEVSSSNTYIDVDGSGTAHPASGRVGPTFTYQLDVDTNGIPKPKHSSGKYYSLFSLKGLGEFESEMTYEPSYFKLQKLIRGNYARSTDTFTLAITVSKNQVNAFTGNKYSVVRFKGMNGTTPIVESYRNDCPINSAVNTPATCYLTDVKADDIFLVGYTASGTPQFIPGMIDYHVEETAYGSYTPSWAATTAVTSSTILTSGSRYPATGNKSLADGDELTFVNTYEQTLAGQFFTIVPFVILAFVATGGVIVLKKSSSKKNREE